jgi:hypothetical protein
MAVEDRRFLPSPAGSIQEQRIKSRNAKMFNGDRIRMHRAFRRYQSIKAAAVNEQRFSRHKRAGQFDGRSGALRPCRPDDGNGKAGRRRPRRFWISTARCSRACGRDKSATRLRPFPTCARASVFAIEVAKSKSFSCGQFNTDRPFLPSLDHPVIAETASVFAKALRRDKIARRVLCRSGKWSFGGLREANAKFSTRPVSRSLTQRRQGPKAQGLEMNRAGKSLRRCVVARCVRFSCGGGLVVPFPSSGYGVEFPGSLNASTSAMSLDRPLARLFCNNCGNAIKLTFWPPSSTSILLP